MHWIDYLLVALPLGVVLFIGLKTQRYVRNVADFLTAGRVAGRYVVAVASGEAALGLVSVVAMMEMYYNTGFAVAFWGRLGAVAIFFFSLTGYCTYRFRETRAMTMGQFLGMRYNRQFRFCAAILQSVSGIINYALFPAVGARFLVYYLDLPLKINLFGLAFPTFGLVMTAFLGTALFIALLGGQVTIMVTDCVQGILSYPMYLVIVAFVLIKFSWPAEMAPALLDRPDGESFLNPYDVEKLRDFNLFYVLAALFMSFFGRMTWSGSQGYSGAAISAHEQKMSGLLGYWRNGFSVLMYVLLTVGAITYMNHANYRNQARDLEYRLSVRTVSDLAANRPELRDRVITALDPASETDAREQTIHELREQDKKAAQTFQAIYRQMLVPTVVKDLLPIGITGIFCALMIFLLLSTDTTYMHSWGSILAQDLILPCLKKPLTPKQQLILLRCCIAAVAVFAFFFALFYSQIDYIMMFFAITGAIWSTGAGPCIVFGLYSRRGNTAGAFASLFGGSAIAVGGILGQQMWSDRLYPLLERTGLLPAATRLVEGLADPFRPFIDWRVTPYQFPINSQELATIGLLSSIALYLGVSLLTGRGRKFDLDRMLHRHAVPAEIEPVRKTRRQIWVDRIISITPEYTRGDKILAWSSFLYTFGFNTIICFALVAVWNLFQPWSDQAWSWYFLVTNILVAGAVGLVSTVWFSIGGVRDLIRLFRRLETKESDDSDDGRT